MRIIHHLRTAFFILLFLVVPRIASATTIDPLTWQELVVDSSLLGIVECEVAGGIVAKYRVIESWRGPAAGEIVSIRIAPNEWEPQFPIALCGERFLVAAYKSPPPTMRSTTYYGPIPLWWRRIPTDYGTPLFQGVYRINGDKAPSFLFQKGHSSLAEFKRDALELLAQSADKKEEQLLRGRVERYLERAEITVKQNKSEIDAFTKKVEQAKGVPELVDVLLAEAARNPETKPQIGQVLTSGGGKLTLATIEKLASKKLPIDEWVLEDLRRRLGRADNTTPKSGEEKAKPPTEQQLAEFRASLKEQRPLNKAIEVLTEHDPEPVADYLVNWISDRTDRDDRDRGYSLGSYFAVCCGRDRKQNLIKLLSARDDFIRVAGAVYLCFEDRELGMRKLEEFSRLDGDPGVWAALNRARRGDKSAVPRALEVFKTPGDGSMAGVPHRNLQKRLMVLLSNSAKASDLEQPQPPLAKPDHRERPPELYPVYKPWWDANGNKVTMSDPWLPILEEQKVD